MTTGTPVGFCNYHNKIPFLILFEILNQYEIVTDKWLIMMTAVFRTCHQIAKDNKYDIGIKSLIHNYLNNPKQTNDYSNITYVFAEILVTGLQLNTEKFKLFIETVIKEQLNKHGKYIRKIMHNKEFKISELEDVSCAQKLLSDLYTFIFTYDIFVGIVHKNGTNNVIKKIDQNNGTLPLEYAKKLKQELTKKDYNKKTFKSIYEFAQIKYSDDAIYNYVANQKLTI